MSILLGGAGATFGGATNFGAGGLPRSIAVADFNGDSDPDLAVANEGSNNVSVLVGGAGGSFTGPTNYPVCSGPTWIETGQFNGDSDPDLAVVNELCHNVSILLGGANATFGTATNFASGNLPDSLTVGEFTGDSDPDLAVANQGSDNVSVLVGAQGGAFLGPFDFPMGDGPTSIASADFDADTDQDIAVANELVDNVGILLGSSIDGFPRPRGATPLLLALVPAFTRCTAPNRIHGPPTLGSGSNDASCNPPAQTSSFLTIGAPDANGAPLNSTGTVRFDSIVGAAGPPEDSDIAVVVNVTDVRCKTGVATCGAANTQAGPDYTGELTPNAEIRLTDNFNGVTAGGGTHAATGQDTLLGGLIQVPCTSTAALTVGSTCTLATTLNAVSPGLVLDGKRGDLAGRPDRGARRRRGRRGVHHAEQPVHGAGHSRAVAISAMARPARCHRIAPCRSRSGTSKEGLRDVGSNFDGAPDLEFRLATEALELEQSGLSYQRVPPTDR